MNLWTVLITPFADYAFMRSALVACMALAIASGPLGTLLLLRRMGSVGNVLSHAVMPGAAVGFAIAGSALAALTVGGLITGIIVAFLMIFGNRFDAPTLTAATRRTPKQVSEALHDALRAALLEQAGEDAYAFVHDRIVESLLNNLQEEGRRDAYASEPLGESAEVPPHHR